MDRSYENLRSWREFRSTLELLRLEAGAFAIVLLISPLFLDAPKEWVLVVGGFGCALVALAAWTGMYYIDKKIIEANKVEE